MNHFDENLLVVGFMEDSDYRKNYNMLCRLIVDAGSDYIKSDETGLTELDYYLGNLERADSLKTFVDDQNEGLLEAAFTLFADDSRLKIEAILRYIVNHQNFKLRDDNVVSASKRSDYVFFKLVEAGGNIHHKYTGNWITPLHASVVSQSINIVKYLLQQGVDVNCLNSTGMTPMHFACKYGYLNMIELLIQKDVDLNICSWHMETPIEAAMLSGMLDAVSLVLKSKVADNLIFDVLYKLFCCLCQLFSIKYTPIKWLKLPTITGCNNIFQLLWKKLLKHINGLPSVSTTKVHHILWVYLNNNTFRSKNFSNGLKIILTSEAALRLLQEYATHEKTSIFTLVIPKLYRAGVVIEDSIELLKLILNLGFTPNLKDMAEILFYRGFKEEFRYLSQFLPDDCLIKDYEAENPMQYLASVLCGLEGNVDYKKIFGEGIPVKCYKFITQYFTPALSNCSFKCKGNRESIPNILSLKEISRNSVRQFIKEKKEIMSPKRFISTISFLKVPSKIKDFIMLKISLDEL